MFLQFLQMTRQKEWFTYPKDTFHMPIWDLGEKKEKNRIENVTIMGHSSPKNIINNIFINQEKLFFFTCFNEEMRSDITATIAALISSAAAIVYKIAVAFCFCHNLTPHLFPHKVPPLFCSYSDQLKGFKDDL